MTKDNENNDKPTETQAAEAPVVRTRKIVRRTGVTREQPGYAAVPEGETAKTEGVAPAPAAETEARAKPEAAPTAAPGEARVPSPQAAVEGAPSRQRATWDARAPR